MWKEVGSFLFEGFIKIIFKRGNKQTCLLTGANVTQDESKRNGRERERESGAHDGVMEEVFKSHYYRLSLVLSFLSLSFHFSYLDSTSNPHNDRRTHGTLFLFSPQT